MADPADDDTEEVTPPAAAPTTGAAPAPAAPPAPSGPDFTSLVKGPGEMGPLQDQLAAIQRAKTATNAANADETTKRLEVDRARMEQAYKASATMPDELKSGWDAKAKSAEHSTDPVQAFGSLGSVFAMLASSFAGLPMEAGLNAGAAAINAIHAGDEKAYNREYEAWKANTDLALKRQNLMHQAYNDATNLMNSNINAGRTKMELAATKFGDQKAQALLDAGMDKELFGLITDRAKAAYETDTAKMNWEKQHEQTAMLRADPDWQSGDLNRKMAALQRNQEAWAAGGKSRLAWDAEADYMRRYDKENPTAGLEERTAALMQFKKDSAAAEDTGTSDGGMKSNTPEKLATNKFIEEFKAANDGREPSSDELLAFKKKFAIAKNSGGNSTPEKEATAKFVEEYKTANGGQEPSADERLAFKSKWTTATKALGSEAKLGPEDAKFLAEQALKGDTSVFTNLGRGKQGAENVLAVRHAIREVATARGLTGADVALKNAEYQGLRAAERVAGSREAIISVAANEASNMMTVAEEASKKVPRGRWTPINEATQYIMKKSSDPALAAFAQANETLVNGYVRAVSPTGVPTDIVRRHAYAALNSAMGPEAYAAVLKIMRQEMDAAVASPEQVRRQLMERSRKEKDGEYVPLTTGGAGTAQPVAPPVPPGGIIKYDIQGNRVSP